MSAANDPGISAASNEASASAVDAPHGAAGRKRRTLRTWHLLLPWTALMAPLCWWGLPGRDVDALLFGGAPAWSAERLRGGDALRTRGARDAGADTDANPITDRANLIELTADDEARAAILLRYRLYSRQPDEMITFMALQRMKPRTLDFDPRLYQYGGGYIYLIGGCIGATSAVGLTRLTSDVGVYLEQPELFGRFYVVARFVSLAFGAAALVAVMRLARRTGGRVAGWFAFACTAASPVFITGVLEAKPHLPSACMILWAIDSAIAFIGRGRVGDAVRAGLQSGYAFGLVLTGVVAGLLIPLLFVIRRRFGAALLAGTLFVAVYVSTNPYVVYNAAFNRAALRSNLQNSTAMYSVERIPAGAARVGELLVESCGWGVLTAGVLGALFVAWQQPRAASLAAAPMLALLAITIAIGAGKPAEYARFLLLPVLLLCAGAGVLLARVARESFISAYAGLIAVLALTPTAAYIHSFGRDAFSDTESRRHAAAMLADAAYREDAVGVLQEPAPYAVPPIDFTSRRVVLLPKLRPVDPSAALPEWLIFTADDERWFEGVWWLDHYRLVTRVPGADVPTSPIAWANKPVFIFIRKAP